MTLPAHRYVERAERAKKNTQTQDTGNFAFDIDGTIDAFPREMNTIIAALTAAAHHVYIISGLDAPEVTPVDVEAKRDYLISLGLAPECYYQLIIIPEPHAENKLKAIQDNDIGVLFDNNRENIKVAAKGGCLALLLWNSREK